MAVSSLNIGHSARNSQHGTKMDAICKLIKRIAADEKILVFAQYDQSIDKLVKTLVSAGIPHSDLRTEETSADTLDAFQNSLPTEENGQASRVLILNIGEANPAGR